MEKATMTHLTQTDINTHLVSLLEDYPFDRAMKKFFEDMSNLRNANKLSNNEFLTALKLCFNIVHRNMLEEKDQ